MAKNEVKKMKIINVIRRLFHSYNYIDELDVSKLSDEELETIISEILYIEEIPSALNELYKRKPDIAFDLSKSIVEEERGDKFLQGATISVIFEYNNEYVINFVKNSISNLNYYVYGSILDCIAVESKQPFGENLCREFLEMLANKYYEYTTSEKEKIAEEYNFFTKSYSIRMS